MSTEPRENALHRFFAGLSEQTFQTRLGVVDPPLVDYISQLLTRFVHTSMIYRIRDLAGRRLLEIAEMLAEADARIGVARRDAHRHVGDFILFWSGVYPESLGQLQGPSCKDHLLDYNAHGKRAYYLASTIPGDTNSGDGTQVDDDVLRRLSHEFELCQYGLREVRREWERRDDGDGFTPLLIN
jgi:hypothetical protein